MGEKGKVGDGAGYGCAGEGRWAFDGAVSGRMRGAGGVAGECVVEDGEKRGWSRGRRCRRDGTRDVGSVFTSSAVAAEKGTAKSDDAVASGRRNRCRRQWCSGRRGRRLSLSSETWSRGSRSTMWGSRRELRVGRNGFAEAASREEDGGVVVMWSVARLRGKRHRRRCGRVREQGGIGDR